MQYLSTMQPDTRREGMFVSFSTQVRWEATKDNLSVGYGHSNWEKKVQSYLKFKFKDFKQIISRFYITLQSLYENKALVHISLDFWGVLLFFVMDGWLLI